MNEKGRWNGLPLVIFGSGGISREVAQLVEDINANVRTPVFQVIGFIEADGNSIGLEISAGLSVISCDKDFKDFASNFSVLGVVIPQGNPKIKRRIHDNILANVDNLVFPNLVHPSVIIPFSKIKMGIGNVITAGVITNIGLQMGSFNLFNTGAIIGHDVIIGNFCNINGVASVSGEVVIGDEVLIGTGASIIQGKRIGTGAVVSMGSAVIRNVPDFSTAIGVPAKIIKRL